MLKQIKGFTIGFITCALIGVTSFAFAQSADINISSILSGTIKMKLNGTDFTPKESDGSFVKPIIYNGRTYLPVRCLGEALNIPIEWEDATKTVHIGGISESVPITNEDMYKCLLNTIFTKDAELLSASGKTYKWGIVNEKPNLTSMFSCNFYPNSKYKYFKASIFVDDKTEKAQTIEFKKDSSSGEIIKSITVNPGETYELNMDITGVNEMWVDTKMSSGLNNFSKLIIGEPLFSNK
ncbi:MAG: stalk domain-containing protein [Bacillota bacterium]|nr:stalk domain-containing protein [Bacillota bacterium]